jgi:membrane associated rhomboid family serine protease
MPTTVFDRRTRWMLESGSAESFAEAEMIPLRDDNPTRRFPIVVVLLIAANIGIFLYSWLLQRTDVALVPVSYQGEAHAYPVSVTYLSFICTYGAVPRVLLAQAAVGDSVLYSVRHMLPPGVELLGPVEISSWPLGPVWLSIFTSMFLHGGLLHIASNMLYLWIFGNNVEDVLGHVRFVIFYLLCGAVAAATQIVMSLHSLTPMVGASGAIAGVLGAYYVKFPHARVRCLVFLFFFVTMVMLPASLVLLLWFLLQVWESLKPAAAGGGGVAFFAHIGGFLAGWALIRRFEPRRKRPVLVDWWP